MGEGEGRTTPKNESKSRVLVHPRNEGRFKKDGYIDLTHWFGYILKKFRSS